MSWSEDIFISLEREHNKPVGIKMCLPSTTTDTVVNSGCQEKVISKCLLDVCFCCSVQESSFDILFIVNIPNCSSVRKRSLMEAS